MTDEQHIIRDELYEQVGKALTWWSHVEETLCSIYIYSVLKTPNDPALAAASAYWAIVSFDGKLKMTDAAVQFRAGPCKCILDEWNGIFASLGRKAKKRNELAHGTVATANIGTYFIPSFYKSLYKTAEEHVKGEVNVNTNPGIWPKQRLTRNDIKQRRKGFQAINARLIEFRGRYVDWLKRPPEDRERPPEADPSSQNQENQTQ